MSKIAVKSPIGITDRFDIEENIMQGGQWGSIQCSIEVDELGKECMESGEHLYKYKDCVDVSTLAMIDDLAAISKCGPEATALNTFINEKIKAKKLEFGPTKCVKLHVKGKKKDYECPILISETLSKKSVMERVDTVKYLGDYVSSDGSNTANILAREQKGNGIVNQLTSLINDISLGSHYFKIGLLYRDTNLINGLLFNSEVLKPHFFNLIKTKVT